MEQQSFHFRDNPKLGDGNCSTIKSIVYRVNYFRDNPKLGDGNHYELPIEYMDLGISEITPNQGTEIFIQYIFFVLFDNFRDNPKLGDGNHYELPIEYMDLGISEITPNQGTEITDVWFTKNNTFLISEITPNQGTEIS